VRWSRASSSSAVGADPAGISDVSPPTVADMRGALRRSKLNTSLSRPTRAAFASIVLASSTRRAASAFVLLGVAISFAMLSRAT